MIRINLLPYREEQKKANIQRQVIVGVTIVALFFIVVVVFHLDIGRDVALLDAEVKSASARLNALTGVTGNLERFQRDKETLQKKIGVIQNLERDRNDSVHIMDELASRISPQTEWLMTVTKKEGTIRIQGVASNNPAIAQFMKRLEASPYIETVDLVSSRQTTVSGAKLMEFVLLCTQKRG